MPPTNQKTGTKPHSKSNNKYKQYEIIQMLYFCLVDKVFVLFDKLVFQQNIGILISTNCPPLLTWLFLNAYEAVLSQEYSSHKRKHKLARKGTTTSSQVYMQETS